jgi:hypothetical protein
MKTSRKIAATGAAAALLAIVCVYALFHGYFDSGYFEVLRTDVSPTGKIAMVARRYDNQALGGLEYFVVIGDHTYSPRELRHALHYGEAVFDTANECVAASWAGPSELTVDCRHGAIPAEDINSELHRFEGITISYRNVSPRTASQFSSSNADQRH